LNVLNLVLSNLFSLMQPEENEGEKGQTLVEYGLILALISIAAIAVMGTIGGNIVDVFTAVSDELHS
jgi:pilus assembly protein Flp/PilA